MAPDEFAGEIRGFTALANGTARYAVRAHIGAGGMADVSQATDE